MSEGQDPHLAGGIWSPQRNFTKAAQGMEYLGGAETNVAGVTMVGPITFRPRDVLLIIGRITGMSAGTGIPALRFNNDASAVYWTRNLQAAAGGATFAETAVPSTDRMRVSSLGGTTARAFQMIVLNRSAASKSAVWQSSLSTGSAATPGALQFGSGEWVNITSNIQAVTLLAVGAETFSAGSGFGIFGKDLGP